jgi:hypothetical protein
MLRDKKVVGVLCVFVRRFNAFEFSFFLKTTQHADIQVNKYLYLWGGEYLKTKLQSFDKSVLM